MRLNKYIAHSGIASRRKADQLIEMGEVTINGKIASVGMDVDPANDYVKVGGKLIQPQQEKTYIVVYKPAGYLCSSSDPKNRPLIHSLLKGMGGKRLFTVGRLDFNSEGLILMTNDGDFSAKVGHPSSGLEKKYHVRVRGVPDEKRLQILRQGVRIDNYKTRPCDIKIVRAQKNAWVEVVLKEGRNRQIRKMFDLIDHPVVKIRRVAIGPITIKGMKQGDYRLLTDYEIARLTRR